MKELEFGDDKVLSLFFCVILNMMFSITVKTSYVAYSRHISFYSVDVINIILKAYMNLFQRNWWQEFLTKHKDILLVKSINKK